MTTPFTKLGNTWKLDKNHRSFLFQNTRCRNRNRVCELSFISQWSARTELEVPDSKNTISSARLRSNAERCLSRDADTEDQSGLVHVVWSPRQNEKIEKRFPFMKPLLCLKSVAPTSLKHSTAYAALGLGRGFKPEGGGLGFECSKFGCPWFSQEMIRGWTSLRYVR